MNINDITENQKKEILWYYRHLVMLEALQWDAQAAIERILNREISDFKLDGFTVNVDSDVILSGEESGEDLTFITWEDIKEILAEKEN